jgi:hypothetical protein
LPSGPQRPSVEIGAFVGVGMLLLVVVVLLVLIAVLLLVEEIAVELQSPNFG